MKENSKKINVILGDVDGALFYDYPVNPDIPPVQEWLIQSNLSLLRSQLLTIRNEQYDRVIIGYGTNRQDYLIDKYNPGGSCAPVLPLLQTYFQNELDCEVLIEPFLMADLYGNRPAGTSYCSILKELYVQRPQKHSRSVLDDSKISLLYAHMHRAAMNNPDATRITIDFFDDSPAILYKLNHFFRRHQNLMPQNVLLRLHHYEGQTPKLYRKPIQGAGILDQLYVWTVRLFASVCCFNPYEDNDEIKIEHAKDLKDYHAKNKYFEEHRRKKMDMSIPIYDINAVSAFRDNDIPMLGNKDIINVQQSAYVTAQELYQAGLIPGEFVLGEHYRHGLYESAETVALKQIKSSLTEVFNQYISCWKLSFFGHKHNDRAINVLEAILDCQNLYEVKKILNNQYNIFTLSKYESGPIPYLNNRWCRSALIVNTLKKNRQSDYLDMISRAIIITDTAKLTAQEAYQDSALSNRQYSEVLFYPY